ncbi:MAG: hypothetical protein ABIR10_18255 [Dokdonella sp.]
MQMLSRIRAMQWVLLGCLFVSASASATDESLSFRRTASGSIEAVVSGRDNLCGEIFWPANQVTIEGGTITINSPEQQRDCSLPRDPPLPYSVTADLGTLPAQRYDVVWNQTLSVGGPLHVSGVLVPAAIGGAVAMSAPTLSWWGLALLALVLGAFALRHRNFVRPSI